MDFTKLPSLMQDAIKAIQTLHNIPDELALQTVLGVVNFACQSKYNVDSGVYGVVPLSLFLVGIMPTGASKSTTYRELMPGIDKYMHQQKILQPDAVERRALAMAVYKKAKDKFIADALKNNGSMTGLVQPKEPAPLQTCKYITKKGTVNGFIKLLETQPMLGLFSSEGGEFFNGHAFQSSSKSDVARSIEMTACLTSMWDGHEIDKVTGMEQTDMRDRRVNMLLLLQENVVREFLNNPAYAEQGFTHRVLIAKCEMFKKPKLGETQSQIAANKIAETKIRASLQGFHDRIFELLDDPFAFRMNDRCELNLPVMTLDINAQIALNVFFNGYNDKVLSSLNHKNFTDEKWEGFINRCHEIPLRIAATLAVFEKRKVVEQKDVEAAISLFKFYVDQRENLDLAITPHNSLKVSIANDLIKWVKERNFDDTLRIFKQDAPKQFKKLDADQRVSLINEMISTGEVELYSVVNKNGVTVEKLRKV